TSSTVLGEPPSLASARPARELRGTMPPIWVCSVAATKLVEAASVPLSPRLRVGTLMRPVVKSLVPEKVLAPDAVLLPPSRNAPSAVQAAAAEPATARKLATSQAFTETSEPVTTAG